MVLNLKNLSDPEYSKRGTLPKTVNSIQISENDTKFNIFFILFLII